MTISSNGGASINLLVSGMGEDKIQDFMHKVATAKQARINHLYKIARKFTIYKKIKFVNSLKNHGNSILDYGCGTGEFLKAIKENGWNTTGFEPSERAKSFAIENYHLNILEEENLKNVITTQNKSVALLFSQL